MIIVANGNVYDDIKDVVEGRCRESGRFYICNVDSSLIWQAAVYWMTFGYDFLMVTGRKVLKLNTERYYFYFYTLEEMEPEDAKGFLEIRSKYMVYYKILDVPDEFIRYYDYVSKYSTIAWGLGKSQLVQFLVR
jgi:hypothetical protein